MSKPESPCLTARIWDNAIAQLQEQGERKLFAECAARDERYRKLVAIYRDYYDTAERIDREFPHRPSDRTPGSVIPVRMMPAHADQIHNAINRRKEAVRMVTTVDDEEHRGARRAALAEHEAGLRDWEPCRCTSCFRR